MTKKCRAPASGILIYVWGILISDFVILCIRFPLNCMPEAALFTETLIQCMTDFAGKHDGGSIRQA